MNTRDEQEINLNFELDRIVHEPARLKILTYLYLVKSADFVFLISRTGLTMGNLSTHMSKLQKAGYITVLKEIKDNRPHTMLSLTETGQKAFEQYKISMQELLEG